jgi:hypothetical protein
MRSMDEIGVQQGTDPLLLPFLNAGAEAEALDILTDVIRVHAEPVIKAIIRHKLRVFLDGRGAGRAAQEAEDVESEVVLHLLTKLREVKADPRARGIGNFRSYVAHTTRHACHEVLRRKYPQRWRLKNRLRYLLTHHESFALWGGEGEEWLCGLAAWRDGRLRGAGAGRLESLLDARAAADRLGPGGRNLQLINPSELLTAVFKYLNAPVTNFAAALNTYAVGGTVKVGTAALPSVTMKLTSPVPAGFAPRTATPSSAGVYTFANLPAGRTYTITPAKTGYTFAPLSKTLTNLGGNVAAGSSTNFTGVQ